MRSAASRRAFLLAWALLSFAASARGASVEFSRDDILRLARQKYPDKEIVRLIRVSDSRFALTADDLLALRAAGAGEAVLREMMAHPSTHAPEPDGPAAGHSRVTIRGSGSEVRIVGDAIARGPDRRLPPDVLAELGRLAREGFSDETLFAYARARRSEIPPVIGGAEYDGLRRSGMGEQALGYLAAVAAIDVGATGEAGEAAVTPGYAMEVGAAGGYPGDEAMPYPDYAWGVPYGGVLPRNHRLRSPSPFETPRRDVRPRPFPHRTPMRLAPHGLRPLP
jgi:hypothetical protein